MVPALAVADALRAEGARRRLRRRRARRAHDGARRRLRAAPDRRRGAEPQQPAEGGARGAARPARRSARRGGSCATCAPTPCSAPAATSPGRSGSRRWPRRVPIVLAEADSHLGLTNRLLARWARRVCLAFPIDGRDGERYLVTGRPVPPPATDRAAARARFGLAPDDTLRARVRRLAGRAHDQRGGGEALAGAEFRVLHACGRARLRRRCARGSARSAGQLRPARVHHAVRRGARWPATCASRAPAARSSRSPPTGARRSSCPIPTRRPTTRAANARWMAQAGAAVVVADAELTPERLASEVRRCWPTARGCGDGRASASLARPAPLSGSPRRCSPRARAEPSSARAVTAPSARPR